MISFDWNSETSILVISGKGTLYSQVNYTNANHITVEGFSSLGGNCFSNYKNLVSISLSDSITSIGNDILQNTKVTSLHLPISVRYLSPSQSFDQQYYLENLTVDPDNPYFRDINGVLYSKNMKELHFYPGNRPETTCFVRSGVEIIKVGAFGSSLIREVIIIPPTVRKIEWGFGYDSKAIKNVTILQCPKLIKIDKNGLFSGTSKGEEIIFYEYIKCIFPKTCKARNNNRIFSNNIFFMAALMIAF